MGWDRLGMSGVWLGGEQWRGCPCNKYSWESGGEFVLANLPYEIRPPWDELREKGERKKRSSGYSTAEVEEES